MARRTESSSEQAGGQAALDGTAEGATVARTQRAGKARWSVYEQLGAVDVYDEGVVTAALVQAGGGEGIDRDLDEVDRRVDEARRAEDATVLVLLDGDVEARRGEDACWMIAEGMLRDRAESDTPPVLVARNNRGDGFTEAKPYGLERVVQRRRA